MSRKNKKKSAQKKFHTSLYKLKKDMKTSGNEIDAQIKDFQQRYNDVIMHINNLEYMCMIIAKAHIERYESDPTTDPLSEKWARLNELKYLKQTIDNIRTLGIKYQNTLSMIRKVRSDITIVMRLVGESMMPVITELQEKMQNLLSNFNTYANKNVETLTMVKDVNPDAAAILVALEQAKEHMLRQFIQLPEGTETMDLQIEETIVAEGDTTAGIQITTEPVETPM